MTKICKNCKKSRKGTFLPVFGLFYKNQKFGIFQNSCFVCALNLKLKYSDKYFLAQTVNIGKLTENKNVTHTK